MKSCKQCLSVPKIPQRECHLSLIQRNAKLELVVVFSYDTIEESLYVSRLMLEQPAPGSIGRRRRMRKTCTSLACGSCSLPRYSFVEIDNASMTFPVQNLRNTSIRLLSFLHDEFSLLLGIDHFHPFIVCWVI